MKTRIYLVILLALAFTLPVVTLVMAKQAGVGSNALPRPQGPCDIYAATGTPCVAAHSTSRALSASYNGPLYQVRRQSDGTTHDIGVVQPSETDPGGYANAAAQDEFCANTICWINTIYDQSGKGNDLVQAPPGTFKGPAKGGFDTLPIADMAPVSIRGHKVYGVYIMPGMGFRNNNASGLAINDEPEGIYYVIDGTHYDSGCCFDYGNASTNGRAVGTGTMETVYFGTATAWGSGDGPGPWIMSDMEAGLFSGYEAKKNAADPTIDSWRFVTAVVNGGGGNKWELRGGNAQQGGLKTFYDGVRPGSKANNRYFPMHKQGAVLLGTGGDNGNGSSGTFYEGVMTTGYPTDAATDAVQANIVAAKYNLPNVSLSLVRKFTPRSTKEVTVSFANNTGVPAAALELGVGVGGRGVGGVVGPTERSKAWPDPFAPDWIAGTTFKVMSRDMAGEGFVTGNAKWMNAATGGTQSETAVARIRTVVPVKINEVLFGAGANPTNQFIELYNAGDSEVDISNWTLIHTQSQWAPVKLATIPAGTKLAAHGFYLLGLAASGLAAPASRGDATINVRSVTGFASGQEITVDGETRKIASVGTAATAMTTLFIPVSTGPWLTIPAGSTNLPVTSAAGFAVGQKIGIDIGGNYEVAEVKAVGKAATQTTLAAAAATGATNIKVAASADISVGDTLTVGTEARKEIVKVKSIVTTGAAPGGAGAGRRGGGIAGELELAAPLKFDHASGVDVSDPGTGISFSPVTKFPHTSGDAVQALGSGITLDSPVAIDHAYGAAVVNSQATSVGYQGLPAPNQWFGGALSPAAGSIALLDAGGKIVDAVVYGSQQSSSSANGTITSPELAVLVGDQGKGGCIVVVPNVGRGGRGRGAPASTAPSRSVGRTTDGADTGSICTDFQLQTPTPGTTNKRP